MAKSKGSRHPETTEERDKALGAQGREEVWQGCCIMRYGDDSASLEVSHPNRVAGT